MRGVWAQKVEGEGAGGAPAPAYPSRGLLQQQLHVVVLDAHRGVLLAPAGEDLQRLLQAVGGRHLVPPGPHLHGADDDLQLHALVHLGDARRWPQVAAGEVWVGEGGEFLRGEGGQALGCAQGGGGVPVPGGARRNS